MNRAIGALTFLICIAAGQAPQLGVRWTASDIEQLRKWVEAAPDDALPRPDTRVVAGALASGEAGSLDSSLDAVALDLARDHLLGFSPPAARRGWNIADSDAQVDLRGRLDTALAAGKIDAFFAGLRPQSSDYAALRGAYAAETDPTRRGVIARNMERWRWLPQSLGEEYLQVNAAAFEASLWRHGERAATWRVIVGKPSTPTPVFAATVTGVNFNPWWDVPSNIVREGIGGLIRRNPAAARARGYVWSDGNIRQRPGPGNALGQLKLVMPNPYSVYLHDTPNRELFKRDVRAFSHGCVRVGDAPNLAATLLEGVVDRSQVDALIASEKTQTVDLAHSVPIYVTYFTAGLRGDGSFSLFPDIYGRDARMLASGPVQSECSASRG